MENTKCSFCGGTETKIGGGQVWCANEYCGAPLGNVHIGLIEGRHEMPVDGYLLAANVTESAGFHEGVYRGAKDAAAKLVSETGNFDLYLTGLTVAAIGAVEGMRQAGVAQPVVCNYDAVKKEFVRIDLDA